MPAKGNEDIQAAAKIILDSSKTAFKDGQASVKTLVKLLQKADSPEEVQEASKVVDSIRLKMGKTFDMQQRQLKLAHKRVSEAAKKK